MRENIIPPVNGLVVVKATDQEERSDSKNAHQFRGACGQRRDQKTIRNKMNVSIGNRTEYCDFCGWCNELGSLDL
jgi:hypothetical protein